MQLIRKELTGQPTLPYGARFYKTRNGKHIYVNNFKEEFYIVYKNGAYYIVETYLGRCSC